MSDRITAAHELVADITNALEAAGLEDARATLNALEVPSGARHGVVVVSPPTLDFSSSWGDPTASWELHIIAGPPDNYLAAWERIDTIIDALVAGHINLKSAEPGQFQPTQGPALPAYTLTTHPLD
ncbi:hypothetical protein ELQ90_03090 [Labedella phragmitis]|uniref:DUF3168 domain-containing protein n=1 Tax=Labedella phragmitis TaxID=2498849 RepID=A0A3S3ZB99_9MICO|nr:hypothetical protein [Labedella phragmitis]RWZ52935.1 hypothetical protein ELQ90_03090 [Labedella phragmitis]